MMIAFFIITTLIWRSVLPLFYPAATNTMRLTFYISAFLLISKKPQTGHLKKACGVPEIRAPPFI
jgi:hypothetical protein